MAPLRLTALFGLLLMAGCLNSAAVDDQANQPPLQEQIDRLAQFSACMDQAEWTASQINKWSDLAAEGSTVCSSCHAAGSGNFIATQDEEVMYDSTRYQRFITAFFMVTNNGVEFNKAKFKNKATGLGIHPTFIAEDPAYVGYVNDFIARTLAREQAGLCPTPGFPAFPVTP